jgi:hypothetical protein
MLADFKWWRKFKGGVWWKVRLKNRWDEPDYWKNTKPFVDEECLWFEDYTNTVGSAVSDKDTYNFCQGIINTASNGEWKQEANLICVGIRAVQLRELGIPDSVIFRTLMTIMYVAKQEALSSEEYRSMEVKELIKALDI